MKKYLWILLGLTLMISNLIFNYLLLYTNFFESLKEGGFLIIGLTVLFNFPCLIGLEGISCLIFAPLFWFGIGAGVGWLISKNE